MSKNKILQKAIANSFVRIAGELSNIALKSIVVTVAAVKTLEFMGLLVKY